MNQDRAVDELKFVLRASDGNVTKAAALLAISRRQLYRYINEANLFAEVNAARVHEPEWLARSKEICRGPIQSKAEPDV
jgi:hypothetical protein